LNNHTLSSYDRQLRQLTESILQMGHLVRDMLSDALKAMVERDLTAVEHAVATDKQINALDQTVEQQATVVLALQNPMAVDLRFVTSALRIAGELERAGDLAKNIAKRAVKMEKYAIPEKVVQALRQIAERVISMLEDALSAVESRNPEKAVRVWSQDDAVDDLYHDILDAMQAEMTKDPQNILACTHVVFAAKNFERIADYATSLAKTVYYVTSGEPPNKEALRAAFAAMQNGGSNATN
jgi:phosphate transport system protein